jgi:hypothetical protein
MSDTACDRWLFPLVASVGLLPRFCCHRETVSEYRAGTHLPNEDGGATRTHFHMADSELHFHCN